MPVIRLTPLLLACLAFGCSKTETQPNPAPSASAEPVTAPPPSAEAKLAEPPPSAGTVASAEPATSASAKVTEAKTAPTTAKSAAAAPSVSAPAAASASAAPARVVKTVSGTSASADSYTVSISAPSPAKVGETASASVVLHAKSPFHCNTKYPYKFALDSGTLSYPANPVRGMSVSEKTATMSVPFTPTQTGHATLSGTLSFSVCTEDKCMIEKSKLSVGVDAD